MMLQLVAAGLVVFMVTFVPLVPVSAVWRHIQLPTVLVVSVVNRSIVWFVPAVIVPIAAVASLAIAQTQELSRVVINDKLGGALALVPVLTAPIAPEPFVPVMSAPTILATIILLMTIIAE